MRKLIITAFISLALSACSDTAKKQEKELLDNILKTHDKVMGDDEALMKNKMVLDSLLKMPAKDTAEKVAMKAMDLKLLAAEESMETWMHQFEPDVMNKSHDDIMKYYESQKKAINTVDSLMSNAITKSNKYLSNRKK